jgi:hypothetical protein
MWNSNHQDVVVPHNRVRNNVAPLLTSFCAHTHCTVWREDTSFHFQVTSETCDVKLAIQPWHCVLPSSEAPSHDDGPAAVGVGLSRVLCVTPSFVLLSSTGEVEEVICSTTTCIKPSSLLLSVLCSLCNVCALHVARIGNHMDTWAVYHVLLCTAHPTHIITVTYRAFLVHCQLAPAGSGLCRLLSPHWDSLCLREDAFMWFESRFYLSECFRRFYCCYGNPMACLIIPIMLNIFTTVSD